MVPEACPLFPKKTADRSELKESESRIQIRDWELREVHQRMLKGWIFNPTNGNDGFAHFAEWLRVDPIIPPPNISTQPRAFRRQR